MVIATPSARAAKHSSGSAEWYTPNYILNPVKKMWGQIDFDPASCWAANQRIRATWIGTQEDDSLQYSWDLGTGKPKTVFLNPPGGKTAKGDPLYGGGKPYVKLFWNKLIEEVAAGHVKDAIFLAFSMEVMQTTQIATARSVCEFWQCVPSRRISFIDEKGEPVRGNTHASVLVYVPGTQNRSKLFVSVFGHIGCILPPCLKEY